MFAQQLTYFVPAILEILHKRRNFCREIDVVCVKLGYLANASHFSIQNLTMYLKYCYTLPIK